MRRGGAEPAAAIARTRSRSSGGASGRAWRRWDTSSGDMGVQLLLELREGAGEPRRACGRADAEHARRGRPVEVDDDAERDQLALGRRQPSECAVERGGEALGEARLLGLRQLARERVLAADASSLGPEMVERDRAGELAEPGPGAAAGLVEAVPEADGALEGLGGQILREAAVAGQVGEVAVDVVQVLRRGLLERGHRRSYAAGGRGVTGSARAAPSSARSGRRP